MDNKDNKKLAMDFETNFKPEIIVKTNEDKQQEELSKYFEDYKYVRGKSFTPKERVLKLINTEGPIHIDDIYDSMKKYMGRKATKNSKQR